LELECGDPPEDKECSKGRYKKVSIVYGSDGKSTIITCEPTREFDRKKKDKGKSNEFRDRQRDDWDKRKPQRDEQDADRRKYKEKLADRKKEIEKLAEEVRKSVEESDRKKVGVARLKIKLRLR
jgi:uncharacterized FlaG/YvyC family protein